MFSFFAGICIAALLKTNTDNYHHARDIVKRNPKHSKPHTYYVSPSGNDKNKGLSSSAPWKSIEKVNATTFMPGDRVLFEGGRTFEGRLIIKNGGSSKSSISFSSYGKRKAIINAGESTGIYAYNVAHIKIERLIVSGNWDAATQAGNDSYGVFFYNDKENAVQLGDIMVNNCEIKGFAKGGVGVLSSPADNSQSGYNNITITNNLVHDNGHCGISTVGPSAQTGDTAYAFQNVHVAYNSVYNNLGIRAHSWGHSGNGIMISDASGGVIEHNVAYNNGWYNTATSGGPAAIWCYDSRNLIFQYNESHHNGTGAGTPDGDGFDLDGGAVNCIIQYNYSHDNYGAGFLLWEFGNPRIKNSGNVLRYNISQNDNTNDNNTVYGAVCIGPDCNENTIYNNTLWTTKGSAVFVTGGNGNRFYNNIFFTAAVAPCIVGSQGSFFLNNNYYNPNGFSVKFAGEFYNALEAFRSTGNEVWEGISKGANENPQLARPGLAGTLNTFNPSILTEYSPVTASPMIDAGFNLKALGLDVGSNDFRKDSIPIGGGYDIGACEWR